MHKAVGSLSNFRLCSIDNAILFVVEPDQQRLIFWSIKITFDFTPKSKL